MGYIFYCYTMCIVCFKMNFITENKKNRLTRENKMTDIINTV